MKFNLLVVVPPGPLGLTIAADQEGFCSVIDVKSESAQAFFKRGDILLSLNGQPLFRKPPPPPAAAAASGNGNNSNAEIIKDWVETVANSSYLERHIAVYRRGEHQQEQRRNNDTKKAAAPAAAKTKAPKAAPKVAPTTAAAAPVAAANEPAGSTLQQQNEENNTAKWNENEDRDDPVGMLRVIKYISELRRNFDKDGKKPTLLVAKQIRWMLFEGVMLLAENDEKSGMLTVKFGSQVGGAPQTWIRPTKARLGTSKKSQNRMGQEVMSAFDHCTANLSDTVRSDFAAELCKKFYYEHGQGRFYTDEERQKICLFDMPKEMLDMARREYEKAHPPPKKIPIIFEVFPSVREEIVAYAKANVNEAGMVTKAQMVTYVNDELIPAKMTEWMERHKDYCTRRILPENTTEFAKRVLKVPYPVVSRTVTMWLTALGFRVVQYHKSFRPPEKAPGPQDALVHSQKIHRIDHIFHDQPGETQCSAISTRGRQCTFIAIKPTRYCSVHADYETNPPKPKKRRMNNDTDDNNKKAAHHTTGSDDEDEDDDVDTEEEDEVFAGAQQQQQQQEQQRHHHHAVATTQPVVPVARYGYHRYY